MAAGRGVQALKECEQALEAVVDLCESILRGNRTKVKHRMNALRSERLPSLKAAIADLENANSEE